MAIYKRDIASINLETGTIHRTFLNHSIGYKDQKADHFGIRVFRDGEPVDLTGVSVQGVFMPPQGDPIAITSGNIVSGNVAEVVLPQACYNYDGQFTLSIKLVDATNAVTGTMRIVDGMVDNTHASGTVAPTDAVPTYQEILAVYAQLLEDVTDYESVVATQDEKIDDLKSALVSASVSHKTLEISDISSFTSDGMTFNKVSNGLSISGQSSTASTRYFELFNGQGRVRYSSSETYKFLEPGTYILNLKTVQNAPSKEVVLILTSSTYGASSIYLRDGNIFTVSAKSALAIRVQGSTQFGTTESPTILDISVNSFVGDSSIQYTNRLYQNVNNWITGNYHTGDGTYGDWTKAICTKLPYIPQKDCSMFLIAPADVFIKVSEYSHSGSFIAEYGNHNVNDGVTTKEIKLKATAGNQYQISIGIYSDGSASQKLTQAYLDGVYVYSNVDESIYDIEATGTSADRTEEINNIINQKGTCNFGPGLFCIKGIILPEGTMVQGCGKKTEIRLTESPSGDNIFTFGDQSFTQEVINEFSDTQPAGLYYLKADVASSDETYNTCRVSLYKGTPYASATRVGEFQISRGNDADCYIYASEPFVAIGFISSNTYAHGEGKTATFSNVVMKEEKTAIIMENNCTVKNMMITGSSADIVVPSANGGMHGIGCYGAASAETNKRGIIDGCLISRFSGGGINVYGTGQNVQGLNISNCYVNNCYCGFYCLHVSEFIRVSNSSFIGNYIGVYNNGGNNQFTGCNMSANSYGIMMGTGTKHPNGTHGGCCGCIMQHNTVRAVYIDDEASGFIFDGCNIDDGGTYINRSYRIIFNACNFSKHFSIHVFNSGLVMFCNSNMRDLDPTVAQNDPHEKVNSIVKFINCYDAGGNEMNPFGD